MKIAGTETGSGALDVLGLDLYWIPLGAGADVVRLSGRAYEWAAAHAQHRQPCDLYHSALVARSEEGAYVIEMTPIPAGGASVARGVVSEGPVGVRLAGRIRVFRYEIRRWRNGVIPDIALAVESPVHLSDDPAVVREVLDRVQRVPTAVWGRDELRTGDMWNSNSVVAWLLASVDLLESAGPPPGGGRAPGWMSCLRVLAASRATCDSSPDAPTGAQVLAVRTRLPSIAAWEAASAPGYEKETTRVFARWLEVRHFLAEHLRA